MRKLDVLKVGIIIPLMLVIITTLFGCKFLNDSMIVRPMRLDETKDVALRGALIYGVAETPKEGQIRGLTIMFEDAPDLFLPTPNKDPMRNDLTPFMLEIPYASKGISRIGIKHSLNGISEEYFDLREYKFSIDSNINAPVVEIESNINVSTNLTTLLILNNNQLTTNLIIVVSTNWNVAATTNGASKNIFYLGRFLIVDKAKAMDYESYNFKINRTNMLDADTLLFNKNYSNFVGVKFVPLDVSNPK